MSTGRGYPVFNQGIRNTPTLQGEPEIDYGADGQPMRIRTPSGPSGYHGKTLRRITIDLSNTFTDLVQNFSGTLLWLSEVNGAALTNSLQVKFDFTQNDSLDFVFDRAVSGIPFQRFYVSNNAAQIGVTAIFTVIDDAPQDRIGVNG